MKAVPSQAFIVLSLLVCISASLLWNAAFLRQGFYADDFGFWQGTPQTSVYNTQARALSDWLGFWNPNRGWFYRPTFLSYWAVLGALGLASAPAMHALGLVWHGLIVWLWGALVWRLSRQLALSVLAAASFFFWHGKSEAVWWIAAHSTLLAALLVLLALHAWISWRQSGRNRWYGASLLCFWLGCCSKNEAVAALAWFPMLDAWFLAVWTPRRWLPFVAFIAVAFLFIRLEWHAAHVYAALDHNYNASGYPLAQRGRFVLWFIQTQLNNIVTLHPISSATFAFIPLTLATTHLLRKENNKLWLWSLLVGVSASIPVPFAAGFIALGERFHYIPALGWSLLWCQLIVATVKRGWNEPSDRSVWGMALLLPFVVMKRPDYQFTAPEASLALVLGIAGVCWLLFRCGFWDWRFSATMTLAALWHEAALYLPVFAEPWLLCAAVGALFGRDFWWGYLLCFAVLPNPLLALLFIAALMSLRSQETVVGRLFALVPGSARS